MKPSRRAFLASTLAAGVAFSARIPVLLAAENTPKDVAWLDEVQRKPETLPKDAPTLGPLLVDAAGNKIETKEAWEKRRAEIRKAWLDFLGLLEVERPKPKLEILEEDRPQGVVRQLVRYEAEPGLPVEGYLLRPAPIEGQDAKGPRLRFGLVSGPRPGVLALHSTAKETIRQPAGVEGDPKQAFGIELARRGYVVFCPRCFLWQGTDDYKQAVARFQARHPRSKGMAKMLFDAVRGLDVLESLEDVDRQRLGAVGHSLGAKEALYLAALDERVRTTVSSEGGIDIRFSNWDAIWYLSDAVKQADFTLSHHELLALVAPRPFLLIGGDSADGARSWPYIEAVLPVYSLYGDRRPVGLYNHRQGHVVPPLAQQRIYEWFDTYL